MGDHMIRCFEEWRMIFVTDAQGQCIHISREWMVVTEQEPAAALGRGWVACVHPDDIKTVTDTIDAARVTAAEFSVRYRLLKPDGTARWFGAGGLPSFGMEGGRFIGYLGSITALAEGATDTITAYGNVERFVPPSPHASTTPSCALDLVADHLLMAHALIEKDGGKEALPDLRRALFKIGVALAARTKEDPRRLN